MILRAAKEKELLSPIKTKITKSRAQFPVQMKTTRATAVDKKREFLPAKRRYVYSTIASWARIFKRLWSPGIDSKE